MPRRLPDVLPGLLCVVALVLATDGRAQVSPATAEFPEELRTVAGVRFEGPRELSRRQLRAANLKTRPPSRLPWREAPLVRLDYLRADTAAIASLYRHYGYLDTRVRWRLESAGGSSRTRVVFVIEEGQRARVRAVELQGVRVYPERELRDQLLARAGEPYDPAFLQLDTLRIARAYQERGHFAHVRASGIRGWPESLAVTVRYAVEEGRQHRVRDIVDASEGRLRPELARRELLLRPGDVYRASRVERSIERLYSTGLYQQVQVTPLPDSVTASVDFILRVRERRQRWVDAGIGSGTSDRFRATAQLGHRDLDTRALRGVLQGEFATYGTGRFRRAEVSGTLTEPWLLGVRVQGAAAAYLRRLDDRADPRFVQRIRERGIEFALTREIGRNSRWTLTQRNALVDQSYEVLDRTSDVGDSLAASVVGRYRSNSLVGSVVRDYRDDRVVARRGSIQTFNAEFAGGPLRGTSSYRRAEFSSSWYTPLGEGWNLATRVSAGLAEPFGDPPGNFTPDTPDPELARVPRQSRFFIGGVNSLRGYGENALPADGGLAMALANVELRVPVSGPLGLEFFLDAGNVWTRPEYLRAGDLIAPWQAGRGRPGDLRYTYGAGVRFVLPFGPLRVDFAWGDHPDFPGRGRNPVYQFAIGPSF